MFIEDLKNDFYNVLLGNRVLLLVHYDVDAVCACDILQTLFKCDNIPHTLVPVSGLAELKKAYEENCEEIKYVVLVNCGGSVDLVDALQPEEHVVFFVLDSHKPTDVCNVYSDGQVRLVYKDSEEDIPNFDDIFRDDEDEEEEPPEPGREGLEAAVERRRARRAWEERRHQLMFNYTQYTYYGKPSALTAVELSCSLSRGGWRACWRGAVARAHAAALGLRSAAATALDDAGLHRLLSAQPHGDEPTITIEQDVDLPLYRWWSLWDALAAAPALAPALRPQPERRLRQLLAEVGIPLSAARQSYRVMESALRSQLVPALTAAAARRRVDLARTGAVLRRRTELRAADVAAAAAALLEHESIPKPEGFQLALQCLAGCARAFQLGAAAAQRALTALAALEPTDRGGAVTYCVLNQSQCPPAAGPTWSLLAARRVALAAPARPALLVLPAAERCVLRGVPPTAHTRNLFGAAFEQAAARSHTDLQADSFDSALVSVPAAQRSQFIDALTALMS